MKALQLLGGRFAELCVKVVVPEIFVVRPQGGAPDSIKSYNTSTDGSSASPEQKGPEGPGNRGSLWRQLSLVILINLVTFLQVGAVIKASSLPTSSISTVQLPIANNSGPPLPEWAVDNADVLLANMEVVHFSHAIPHGAVEETWPKTFSITELDRTMINLSWLFGHLLSGMVANTVAEVIGRKKSLLIDTFAIGSGFLIYASGESVFTLCVGRSLMGYPLVSTMYTCELVHPSLRGVAAAIYAVSQALGYSLILLLGAVTPTWRYAIGAVGALTIPTFILLVAIVPESPAWLLRVDREEEAESSLRKIRGHSYDTSTELNTLKAAVIANRNRESVGLWEMFRLLWDKKFRRPFSFLFVLYFALGWSGFVYVALNSVQLFQVENGTGNAGFNEFMIPFLVSLIKIPGALLMAVFLKRFPRRPVFISMSLLVTSGHVIMAFALLNILPRWTAMVALTFAFFGYSAGYNSVAALLLGELLPANLRSVGVGLISNAEVVSSLTQTVATPQLQASIGRAGLFFVFASVVAAAALFAVAFMPETAGLTLEEIEQKWSADRGPDDEGDSIMRNPHEELLRLSNRLASPGVELTRSLSRRWSTVRLRRSDSLNEKTAIRRATISVTNP